MPPWRSVPKACRSSPAIQRTSGRWWRPGSRRRQRTDDHHHLVEAVARSDDRYSDGRAEQPVRSRHRPRQGQGPRRVRRTCCHGGGARPAASDMDAADAARWRTPPVCLAWFQDQEQRLEARHRPRYPRRWRLRHRRAQRERGRCPVRMDSGERAGCGPRLAPRPPRWPEAPCRNTCRCGRTKVQGGRAPMRRQHSQMSARMPRRLPTGSAMRRSTARPTAWDSSSARTRSAAARSKARWSTPQPPQASSPTMARKPFGDHQERPGRRSGAAARHA